MARETAEERAKRLRDEARSKESDEQRWLRQAVREEVEDFFEDFFERTEKESGGSGTESVSFIDKLFPKAQ